MVRKVTFTSLLALVGLTVSVTAAPAPVVTARGTVVDPAIFAREKNRTLRRIGAVFKREKAAQDSDNGGIESLTRPALEGVANPLLTGAGRGVAGAAAGTKQTPDLLGDAINTLLHTLGGTAGNAEQGAGVAAANAAPAVQSTIYSLQNNSGALGDVAKIVGGA